jgi:branched-subunit amino acid ABC-type transport system permease component
VRSFLPFVVAGLTTGSLYSIAALGLVLTYKTSGIFNFAHGAVAAAAAYAFFELHERNGVPWPIAGILCVFVFAPLAGVATERLARGLTSAPISARIVGTVGLLIAVQGTLTAIFGPGSLNFSQFLPTRAFGVLGVNVGFDQVIAFVIAAAAAAGLYAFFRYSRVGVAMRGVVDNPDLLDLAGTNPTRVRTQAWIIGNSFAALSGILLAPKLGLDATLLTLLVVQAFGAAAIGRFESLPLTYLGGLVVGVGGALATKYVADFPNLGGFPSSFPFIVLFGVLLLTPKGRLTETTVRRRLGQGARGVLPRGWVWGGRVALAVAALLVPTLVGAKLPVYTNGLIFVLIFLSLNLLVRTSGQVSLCHAAFAAIGATTFSHLASGLGLPWVLALVGAGLAAVPVGAIVAIPAIRLSGLYLALATFGFGLLVERMVFGTGLMFGKTGNRVSPRPDFGVDLTSDKAFYFVCLAVVVVGCAAIVVIHRSRLGVLLRAMADSPVALATHGLSVNITRVLVFCISAFIAGVAGALFASFSGTISGIGFGAFASLTWLTVLAIAGPGQLSAAVLAALLLAVVPAYADSATYTKLQPVLFGAAALGAALAQGGLARAWFDRATDRSNYRRRSSPVADRGTADLVAAGDAR